MNTNILKSLFILACLFAVTSFSHAQRSVKLGDKYFENFDFKNAIKSYKVAVDKNPENTKAIRGLAYSYKHLNNAYDGAYWFQKLVDLEPDSAIHTFELGQMHRELQEYDIAFDYYNEYMAMTNESFVNDITGNAFDYIEGLKKMNPKVKLQNARALNSPASDFGISFKNYNEVVYCSTRDQSEGSKDIWTYQKYADLYESKASYDSQEEPVKFMGNIYNGIYHDGPAFFYKNEMYLTRSNYIKKKYKKSKGDKTVKLQLHKVNIATEADSKGKEIGQKLVFNDREYSIAHATVSPNGKILVFSSDGEAFGNHLGGTDLYMCTRSSITKDWSSPKNMGPLVNTPADEEYPYFGDDKVMYFASDGHYGMGGLDIYTVEYQDSVFTNLTNIGAPFNTSSDDFNYIYNPNEGLGFLTSNRDGGKGSDDIYTFKSDDLSFGPLMSSGDRSLSVLAYDTKTKETLENVKLEIPDCYEDEFYTNDQGILINAIDDNQPCELTATLEGYYPVKVPFTVFGEDVKIPVGLTPIDENAMIELQVCVYDQVTMRAIPNATVKLYNSILNRVEEVTTDEYGCTIFKGISPDACYNLVGRKEVTNKNQKYLTTTDEVCTHGVESPALLQKSLYLIYGELGQPMVASPRNNNVMPDGFVLPIIYYDLDKFNIREDAARELELLIKVMKDNPSLKIQAASHTDCRRDYAYNMELSKNRAIEAVDYIAEHGILRSRLTWINYGENQHVNECDCECEGTEKTKGLRNFRDCEDAQLDPEVCTEDEHQLNRRTEFVIVSF